MLALIVWAGMSIAQAEVAPLRETATETHQTDDPAVWVNKKHPEKSLILGTVKAAAPDGAIAVYRLDGSRLMSFPNLDRPNNIDVGYGLRLGKRRIDFAVATERNKGQLRIFEIVDGTGIRDVAALPVFLGETGAAAQPMGIAVYKRRRDGAFFMIVSRKAGPSGSYLWQYRLLSDSTGKLAADKVREFGTFSGSKEIEAIAVDAEKEHIYYSDEGVGIRKYHADPQHPKASEEIALFGQSGWNGDREGIAVYRNYVIATDQQKPNSVYHVFSRDSLRELGKFRVGAESTDGIEISSFGLFIAMNDSRHNFILADWKSIAAGIFPTPRATSQFIKY